MCLFRKILTTLSRTVLALVIVHFFEQYKSQAIQTNQSSSIRIRELFLVKNARPNRVNPLAPRPCVFPAHPRTTPARIIADNADSVLLVLRSFYGNSRIAFTFRLGSFVVADLFNEFSLAILLFSIVFIILRF